MTRDETINILMMIQAAYPRFSVPDKTVTVNTWHNLLKEYPFKQVEAATVAYIKSDKSGFAPGIGQVIEKLNLIFRKDDMSELAAWGLVTKAIRRSTYYAEEEFAKLPPTVQKVIGSPSQLKEWAQMQVDGPALTVLQSNFLKSYRAVSARDKERASLNLPVEKPEYRIETGTQTLSISAEREEALKQAVPMPKNVREKLDKLIGRMTLNE